jgi:hypothetical protein
MNVFCFCTNDTLPFSTVRRAKDFCDKLLSMSNVSFKLSVSFEGSFSLDDDSSLDGTNYCWCSLEGTVSNGCSLGGTDSCCSLNCTDSGGSLGFFCSVHFYVL